MLDINFLKTITILYIEDDADIRENFEIIFSKIFHKVVMANDGEEALSLYKDSLKSNQDTNIDVIISDICMPNMDGIELLRNIRQLNKNIPYLFTTGHTNNEYLLEAIKNDVSDYLIKPVETKKLIEKVQNVCKVIYEHKLAIHNQKEAAEYLSIINKVAIVSKTDSKGKITFVNDIFCETSGYSQDELMGKPHNIVRHPDMPTSAFKELWDTVKDGNEWSGKVKNKAKNGEAYHVNATVFPLYDEIDSKIEGYMAIRFLTTQEENQKREFKTQVRELVSKYNNDIRKLREDNNELEIKFRHSDLELMENKVKKEKDKSDKLVGQVNYYEETMKSHEVQIVEERRGTNSKLLKFHNATKTLMGQNKKLEDELALAAQNLHFTQNELQKKSDEIVEKSKTIMDLNDVIKHQEQKLINSRI